MRARPDAGGACGRGSFRIITNRDESGTSAKRQAWAHPIVTVLLLALSGCGGGTPQSCTIKTVADLSLLEHTVIPTVVGRLRNRSVALLLDTGAATSVVARSAVDRLGLLSEPYLIARLTGIGGTRTTDFAYIGDLELGHGHARDFDLPIGPNFTDSGRDLPTLGLFGADFMSDYDVDFDLPHHHFGMSDLAGCGGAIQPVAAPYFEVSFRLVGTAIGIEIQLNGVPVEADLDSGSSETYITEIDAARAGVTADMLANDKVIHPSGVDGFPVKGHLHRFGSLELGAESLKNFPLEVASSAVGITLLGEDFLRLNRIWISYPHRTLFIQPAFDSPLVHMTHARTP